MISELGRSPGEGNGNPLQYSCLGNPMDRGAWRATVQGVAKRVGLYLVNKQKQEFFIYSECKSLKLHDLQVFSPILWVVISFFCVYVCEKPLYWGTFLYWCKNKSSKLTMSLLYSHNSFFFSNSFEILDSFVNISFYIKTTPQLTKTPLTFDFYGHIFNYSFYPLHKNPTIL